jgi:hypothetical protein
MGKAVELSDDAYRQLEKLAQQKQCTVEERVQECVRAYEQASRIGFMLGWKQKDF